MHHDLGLGRGNAPQLRITKVAQQARNAPAGGLGSVDGEQLFRGDSILQLRPERLRKLQEQVACASDEQLEDLAFLEQIEAEFLFRVPSLDEVHIAASESEVLTPATVVDEARLGVPIDTPIPAHVEQFHVPFTGDRELFFVRPSTYLLAIPKVVVKSDEIIVTYRKDGKSVDEVRARFLTDIAVIRDNLFTLEGNCASFNFGLRHEIESAVEAELERRRAAAEKEGAPYTHADVDEG